MSEKSPVTVLQEELAKVGLAAPEYRFIHSKGDKADHMFRYVVVAEGAVTNGVADSKRKAKCTSAQNLLEILKRRRIISNNQSVQQANNDNECISKNPVDQLQEMCLRQQCPLPMYEAEKVKFAQYTTLCKVCQHIEIGKGRSKKLSKSNAAHKMLTFMQALNEGGQNINRVLNYSHLLHSVAKEDNPPSTSKICKK